MIPDFVSRHTQKLNSPGGDGFVPVYVSAVATPGQFWVQVRMYYCLLDVLRISLASKF